MAIHPIDIKLIDRYWYIFRLGRYRVLPGHFIPSRYPPKRSILYAAHGPLLWSLGNKASGWFVGKEIPATWGG